MTQQIFKYTRQGAALRQSAKKKSYNLFGVLRGGQEGPLLTWASHANSALWWDSVSVLRDLFLFSCLPFSSCVGHKDEKGDGSRPWKESRKFLPIDCLGEEDRLAQWSDCFQWRDSKPSQGPDFGLGHSVPCGGPWPLAERMCLLTLSCLRPAQSCTLKQVSTSKRFQLGWGK